MPTPPKLLGTRQASNGGSKLRWVDNFDKYDTSEGHGDSEIWQAAFADRMGLQEATRLVGGRSPFEILGVSAKATWAEIRKAYRKLAMQFHPDKNPGDKKAAETFMQNQAAYEVLEDQYKRGLIS